MYVRIKHYSTNPNEAILWFFFTESMSYTLYNKSTFLGEANFIIEPPHDKIDNVAVSPAKTQISLGIRPV